MSSELVEFVNIEACYEGDNLTSSTSLIHWILAPVVLCQMSSDVNLHIKFNIKSRAQSVKVT